MERQHGLGLRAQIMFALTAAFFISFTALAMVVAQVAQRAQERERARRSAATAEALAVSLASVPRDALPERLARLVGRADIVGVAIDAPEGPDLRFGATADEPSTRSELAGGERLLLWNAPIDANAASPLGRLLRLYLVVTGAAILLLAYVALTRLIVRPVENLTRASERLAEGTLTTNVPVAGAAEVARLALSFNRMARELRSERSALEQRLAELERTTGELRAAQDHLIRSEKLASVGRLAAGIAHEIGNPLAAILGLVELLQLGGLEAPEQGEFLRRIRNETERIHRIIRDLLDYSRAQPASELPATGASLVDVVDEAVKLVAPQKDLRNITIERRFDEGLGNVLGSAHELTQIVLNLLLNAADAVAGEGAILLEVRASGEAEVVLHVSDTGPGIPVQVRDKLFEPFVTTKPAGKGTGLGLAVCQALVERLGGRIGAENRPTGGARFSVWLPLAARGAAAQ